MIHKLYSVVKIVQCLTKEDIFVCVAIDDEDIIYSDHLAESTY